LEEIMSLNRQRLGLAIKFTATALAAATFLAGAAISSPFPPRDVSKAISLVLEIASKKTADSEAQIKSAEGDLQKAVDRLKDTDEFKQAVEKKDSRALSRMIQKEAGVDFPIKVKTGGDGAANKVKVKITVECCPLKGVVIIEF
jgi:hypothetical protein